MKPEKLIIKVFFIAKSFLTTMLTYKKCILKTKQLHNENEEEVKLRIQASALVAMNIFKLILFELTRIESEVLHECRTLCSSQNLTNFNGKA